MNYQLVSIATILRDYIDVKQDIGYLSPHHETLVDIADGVYNTGIAITAMTKEAQIEYAKHSADFWTLVFKDIDALDSQVNTHNVHDLLDDYKYMLEDGNDASN